MKKMIIGILAHVDAGKTTLTEAMLYTSGTLNRLGRVDKGDCFLDTNPLERERGITVFSKMAGMKLGDTEVTLVDTPGHVDFVSETERTLGIQDLCILVISAPDGVQAHTLSLWNLLRKRRVPTVIFVNKTDLYGGRRVDFIENLKSVLSSKIVSFTETDTTAFYENAAGCDERLIGEFLETDKLSIESIREAIRTCRIFPCFFGSALKCEGVGDLLENLAKFAFESEYSDSILGIKVYKIARDKDGKRIAFAKVTGSSLKVKDTVTYKDKKGETVSEKIEAIRVFSGDNSRPVNEATAGGVYALYGLNSAYAGLGIGSEPTDEAAIEPSLNYRLVLPKDADPYKCFLNILPLAEEEPSLSLCYDERRKEIRVSLMGEIQMEVLRRILVDRFGLDCSFDEGEILYKETIAAECIGSGHFEPLRHYAEVHLLIEPLPEGSGVVAATDCDRDSLALNWQRLVMTHIEERMHRGVLTGSPLTDVKITLIAGKAHAKHTEGGDFRQATYRAIRQGLMKTESVLLEPTCDFKIEIPRDSLGRTLNDLTAMCATTDAPEIQDEWAILTGNCPLLTINSYSTVLRAYTSGRGKILLTSGGYRPAHNAEEVIAKKGYDPLSDERNPASSVFCKAGAGYTVPWNEADEKMHIKVDVSKEEEESNEPVAVRKQKPSSYHGSVEEDKELMRIFEATYGKITPRRVEERRINEAKGEQKEIRRKPKPKGRELTVIDGYNLIFANKELTKLAEEELANAREKLILLLSNYAAFKKENIVLVFDAYKRKENKGSREVVGNLTVVYTKERQTADAFIEKTTYEIAKVDTVRVVSSDKAEQFVILGNGALRVSPREFFDEIEKSAIEMNDLIDFYKTK